MHKIAPPGVTVPRKADTLDAHGPGASGRHGRHFTEHVNHLDPEHIGSIIRACLPGQAKCGRHGFRPIHLVSCRVYLDLPVAPVEDEPERDLLGYRLVSKTPCHGGKGIEALLDCPGQGPRPRGWAPLRS